MILQTNATMKEHLTASQKQKLVLSVKEIYIAKTFMEENRSQMKGRMSVLKAPVNFVRKIPTALLCFQGTTIRINMSASQHR